MNRKLVDSLWATALLSACAIGFYPAQGAVFESVAVETPAAETSALRRRPAPRRPGKVPLVSHDFEDADLVYVVKVLAKEMNRNVYIGPGVEGSVTASFRSVPVDAVLASVLKQNGGDIRCKLIGYNTLIVAQGPRVDQIEDEILGKSFGSRPKRSDGHIRQEFLLDNAPAAKIIGFLQGQYKEVEFIPHPTMNGFYAVGSRKDIADLKNDVPNLDKMP